MTDEAGEESQGGPSGAGRAVLSTDAAARDWARTRTSDATAPPPAAKEAVAEASRTQPPAADPPPASAGPEPAAAGPAPAGPTPGGATPAAGPAAAERADEVVRSTEPARRAPLLAQGLEAALVGGLLVGTAWLGVLPLAAAVLVVQVLLLLGFLAVLDAPAARGTFVVALGTTLAADALVLVDDGRIERLAGVVGLGLVVGLLHQLVRRDRSRVTESLADTLLGVVVVVSAACLVALRQLDGGEHVLQVSLGSAAAVLLLGRVGDRLLPRPVLAVGSTRGWPGLVLALAAGAGVAVLVARLGSGELPLPSAALLGLVVAVTVATADLAVDLGAAELRAGWRDARRVSALRPTALLLPYGMLGPVALLAGLTVLS